MEFVHIPLHVAIQLSADIWFFDVSTQCILEFPLACGITVGTPVRVRSPGPGPIRTLVPRCNGMAV